MKSNKKEIKGLGIAYIIQSLFGIVITFCTYILCVEVVSNSFDIDITKSTFYLLSILYPLIILLLGILVNRLKNKLLIKLHRDKNSIYIRDINTKYSPAFISYLLNRKIEVKKDITANILNIISKRALILKYDENKKLVILKGENSKKLTKDEKYLYESIINNKEFDINKFKKIINKQFIEEKLMKKLADDLASDSMRVAFISYAIIFLIVAIFTVFELVSQTIITSTVGVMFGVIFPSLILLSTFIMVIKLIATDILDKYVYTKKGSIEMDKWNKFKRFVKDYSLLEEKDNKEVVVWEEYLAYSVALEINNKYTILKMKEFEGLTDIDIISNIISYSNKILEGSIESVKKYIN